MYYTAPSTVGAMTFWRDLAHKHQVMPTGVLQPNAITSGFFAGKLGLAFLSTGALGHIRSNVKDFELGVAFMPSHVKRGVIIGGASLVSSRKLMRNKKRQPGNSWSILPAPRHQAAGVVSPATLHLGSRLTKCRK